MQTLNKHCEESRLAFIFNRDGYDAAVKYARELIKIYLKASLTTRQKYHTRNYPFRRGYLESACSARHLIRTGFLEQLMHHRQINN